jgi:hypothetical protein
VSACVCALFLFYLFRTFFPLEKAKADEDRLKRVAEDEQRRADEEVSKSTYFRDNSSVHVVMNPICHECAILI